MKKHAFALIPILLALALILIPVVMVYFYRSEFETYEISEVDVHLAEIQNHVRIFVDQNGVDESQLPKAMSSYMLRHSEYGSLIILDSEYELLFPEDPPSRRARGALAEEFAEAIQQGTLQNNSYFDTAEGASLRVSFSGLQGRESGTLYVIAYFDTDNSLAQIDRLESIYLQITVFSALFLLIVVVLFYWNYYRYNRLLSEEILRIGSGSLEPLAVPLSIGASEKLRRSINTALEQIKLTSSRRETLTRSVSHFLRNRLTAIDGYAQGIETGVFSPGEAAVKIRMESFTMEELLHNISVYSFIKEQTLPMNDEILYLSNEIEA